jgi:hypothetical protein
MGRTCNKKNRFKEPYRTVHLETSEALQELLDEKSKENEEGRKKDRKKKKLKNHRKIFYNPRKLENSGN